MKKFNKIFKHAILVSLFSTFFVAITVLIYHCTKNEIVYHIKEEKKMLLGQILLKKMYSSFYCQLYSVKHRFLGNQNYHDLWILFKNNHAEAAVVESIAPDGYSGSIHLFIAAYFDGKIIGVRVISHKETPGIGDKIELSISNWIQQFKNMYVLNLSDKHVLLKKFGGSIEQFTGATITPQAVTNAVKRTVIFIKKIPYHLVL